MTFKKNLQEALSEVVDFVPSEHVKKDQEKNKMVDQHKRTRKAHMQAQLAQMKANMERMKQQSLHLKTSMMKQDQIDQQAQAPVQQQGMGEETELDEDLKAVWRNTHKDYRSIINGKKHILALRKAGTTLVPLDQLTPEEIKKRAGRSPVISSVKSAKGYGKKWGDNVREETLHEADDPHGMKKHLSDYDMRQWRLARKNPRRYHNPYALSQYHDAADKASAAIKGGMSHADAINKYFVGQLARHLHKKMKTGGTDTDSMRRKSYGEETDIQELGYGKLQKYRDKAFKNHSKHVNDYIDAMDNDDYAGQAHALKNMKKREDGMKKARMRMDYKRRKPGNKFEETEHLDEIRSSRPHSAMGFAGTDSEQERLRKYREWAKKDVENRRAEKRVEKLLDKARSRKFYKIPEETEHLDEISKQKVSNSNDVKGTLENPKPKPKWKYIKGGGNASSHWAKRKLKYAAARDRATKFEGRVDEPEDNKVQEGNAARLTYNLNRRRSAIANDKSLTKEEKKKKLARLNDREEKVRTLSKAASLWKIFTHEETNRGRPSQRHPLEGHDYHHKGDAQLRYIAKDAGKAAKAMRGHNSEAEGKYLDQMNDAHTVLHFRRNGMPNWYKKKYGHK